MRKIVGSSFIKNELRYAPCQCECGKIQDVRIVQGKPAASRCIACAKKKHGHARAKAISPTYKSWAAMIARCDDPKTNEYRYYGGRGIKVAERWRTFENFLADMGERPPGTSIDRLKSHYHYAPGNCRWATPREQGSNRANANLIAMEGKTLHLAEWSRIYGVGVATIRLRLKSGWSTRKSITTPVWKINRWSKDSRK